MNKILWWFYTLFYTVFTTYSFWFLIINIFGSFSGARSGLIQIEVFLYSGLFIAWILWSILLYRNSKSRQKSSQTRFLNWFFIPRFFVVGNISAFLAPISLISLGGKDSEGYGALFALILGSWMVIWFNIIFFASLIVIVLWRLFQRKEYSRNQEVASSKASFVKFTLIILGAAVVIAILIWLLLFIDFLNR